METGKSGKYLKYAIGEILLIMIGILLALQVNNWNEQRKQQYTDFMFLETLRTELTLDTIIFSQRISEYKIINLRLENTLELLNTKTQITQNEYELISKAFRTIQRLTPINKNIQRNNLSLANGVLLRIDNQLNQKYLNYIETTIQQYDVMSKLAESLQALVIQDISPNFDISNTKENYLNYDFEFNKIRNNRLIKNAISKSIYYRHNYINWSQMQKDFAAKLLSDIDRLKRLR